LNEDVKGKSTALNVSIAVHGAVLNSNSSSILINLEEFVEALECEPTGPTVYSPRWKVDGGGVACFIVHGCSRTSVGDFDLKIAYAHLHVALRRRVDKELWLEVFRVEIICQGYPEGDVGAIDTTDLVR
jgi:hypothetical protein